MLRSRLGPGLLEHVYKMAMACEFEKRGLRFDLKRGIPASYEDIIFDFGFRADIIVENKVIVEIKSIEALAPVHSKILLTYLRLADMRLGLLVNFSVPLIKEGIRRVVNGLED